MSLQSTFDSAERSFRQAFASLRRTLGNWLMENALSKACVRLTNGQYRPEKHYMRGPGPKAKAKTDDHVG